MDKRDWKTLDAIAKAQGTELPGGGVAVAKKRKCGKCGEVGHNARTCGKDDEPVVQRPAPKASTTYAPPKNTASSPCKISRPAPQYSPAERKHRIREGKELVEAHRLIIYARIERWLLEKHQVIARRVPGVEDLKTGTQMIFVETQPSHGCVEPVKHYRGKVKKFDKKAGRIFFKYQRDTAAYNTDIDMVLNLKVPGRSRYFLLFDGKSAK